MPAIVPAVVSRLLVSRRRCARLAFSSVALGLGILVGSRCEAQRAPATASGTAALGAAATPDVPPSGGAPGAGAATAPATGFSSLGFASAAEDETATGPVQLTEGAYAVFHTSQGDFVARLHETKTPKTVENFIGLATGQKGWRHPITMADIRTPLYNSTTIYKTVENALLYGGDPINRGEGDPGYSLEPEMTSDLKFDRPGILAMDRSGTKSSGSRWFVTLRSFPDWTGRYTIIGQVVTGLDVVRAISRRPTKRPTMPLDPALVNSVEIVRIPAGKMTEASFTTEDGKRYVTFDRNFRDALAVAVEALPVAAAPAMPAPALVMGATTTGTAPSVAPPASPLGPGAAAPHRTPKP